MSDKNLTVFVDGIGRTILGELIDSNDLELVVKNPSIIHVVPNQQTGQISVQLLPFFFKEFTKSSTLDSKWTFNRSNLVFSEGIDLDEKLIEQYGSMYSAIINPNVDANGPVVQGESKPEVVKLFDD